METLRLRRDKNGLGFTIAGGRGSTPYRGNDQVIITATAVATVTTS